MKEAFIKLNSALSDYLKVHNAIFKQKLGQDTDYASLKSGLASSLQDFKECQKYFSSSIELDAEQKGIVLSYTNDAIHAIGDLTKIVNGLSDKADGKPGYGFLKYRKDQKAYHQSSSLHMRYGEKLNEIYSEVK